MDVQTASQTLPTTAPSAAGTKVLVADDDPVTRTALKALLTKRGYEVITARDGIEAYEILTRDHAPTLAVLDWIMPGLDGLELCRRLRDSGKEAYTYIVMLSGRREKQDFIAGLEAGADDYVSKPFNIDELHARMRAGQRVLTRDEHLRSRANEDELTGLFNRGAISEILRRELAHSIRDRSCTSLMLADVDNFKHINDSHGHLVGDAVLRDLSNVLRASVRSYDAVGRYGGEEFMIVLPGCSMSGALEVAERVRCAVGGAPVSTAVGALPVTISIGVACNDARAVTDGDLVVAADDALYRAKRAGRNRVEGR